MYIKKTKHLGISCLKASKSPLPRETRSCSDRQFPGALQIKQLHVPAPRWHEWHNHKDVQVTACFSSARKDRIAHCQHEKLVETSHLHVPLLSKHDPDSY